MDQVCLDTLKTAGTEKEVEIMKEIRDAFEKLDDDNRAFRIFYSESAGTKTANFQMVVAQKSPTSDLVLLTGAYYFSGSKHVGRFLGTTVDGIDMFIAGAQSSILDMSVYSHVREEIVKKLGDRAHKFIDGFK